MLSASPPLEKSQCSVHRPSQDGHAPARSFLERCNPTAEALGKVRRCRILGCYLYRSPGWWAILVTVSATALIVFGNMFVTWSHLGMFEYSLCWLCLIVAHLSALCLVTSEPGIYPRLLPDEPDPLGQDMELVFCRVCRMRRPPRTSHCYECNICVLEHDHHCGLLGACVGVRSLRWFTLYLVTVSAAALMGLLWQLRYLGYLAFGHDLNQRASPPTASSQPGSDAQSLSSIYPPLSLGVLLMDFGVVALVGTGAVYYVMLTLTDTTRREAQRQEAPFSLFKRSQALTHNLKRAAWPPRSLVEPGHRSPEEAEGWNIV